MFEEIALSISTALFFLCTLVVSAVLPTPPSDTEIPHENVSYTDEDENASAVSVSSAPFDITGEWNCQGKNVSFTRDGRMIVGEQTLHYGLSGDTVTVKANVNGEERVYSMKLEVTDSRTMKLNGVTFYRIK